jgi:glycosyltransferase involved in cell wall biosynthesis
MWAKNGERFLPAVLKRIDAVIPRKNVGQKIFVDDSSTDNSVELAKKFGWTVYPNKLGGISGGFNEVLKYVETEFFVSVEQDVLLSTEWFNVISKIVENKDVAVAQGIRVPSHPVLRAIYEDKLKNEFVGKVLTSLDNNIWRTDVIREIGGIPVDKKFRADRDIYPKVLSHGYKWIVCHDAVSIHIREGIRKSLRHHRNAVLRSHRKPILGAMKSTALAAKFFDGMARSWRIVFSKNMPSVLAIYPFMCLVNFKTRIRIKSKGYDENTPFTHFLSQN